MIDEFIKNRMNDELAKEQTHKESVWHVSIYEVVGEATSFISRKPSCFHEVLLLFIKKNASK